MTQNVPKDILMKYGLQNRDVFEHIVEERKLVMALKRAHGYVLHPHMDSREEVLKVIDDAIFGK